MLEIICAGLANVDAVSPASDVYLRRHNIAKGSATCLPPQAIQQILNEDRNFHFAAGGCAANTACGLGALGLPVGFIGKTGSDVFAPIFTNDFLDYGVTYSCAPDPSTSTSVCIIFVTPDKDRSFAYSRETASWKLSLADFADVATAKVFYFEAYLLQLVEGAQLLESVIALCGDDCEMVMLNLGDDAIWRTLDAEWVWRNVDFVMGNREEFIAFTGLDFDRGLARAKDSKVSFVITDGPNPVHTVAAGEVQTMAVPPIPWAEIADTIGAGDQFAAGWLHAHRAGKNLTDCAAAGIANAARIIRQIGPRPAISAPER